VYRIATAVAFSPETKEAARKFRAFVEQHPLVPNRGSITGRVALERRAVHVADTASDPEYMLSEATTLGNLRTQLGVPLLREGEPIGVIALARQRVEPFTEQQVELVQTFADQAVIAIENARLITETQEALEQQTATAEVLQVINSSPGDLGPVFDAMLEKAMRLCGAAFGFMTVIDGDRSRTVAARGVPVAYAAFRERHPTPANAPISSRVRKGEPFIHTVDLKAERFYGEGDPQRRAIVDLGGARTLVAVPLMRDHAVLGAIQVYRTEVRPFSDKQIALLQNFAAQAVIAMENARLITETREALEQQTATAEVLQVINSSPGDLGPVLDAMLDKATRLSDAAFGVMQVYEGERFRTVATRRMPPALAEFLSRTPRQPTPHSAVSRILDGEDFVQFEDMTTEPAYLSGDPRQQAFVKLGGTRSYVAVALRKDDRLLGTIATYRQDVRPFSDKQIALLKNFAAQAVIAMENARLITETQQALEQQTATAEVLQVINSSPGDLQPVFDAMLDKALRLCGADFGVLWTYDGERVHATALRGVPPRFAEFLTRTPHPVGSDNAHGRLLSGEPVVHIADVADDDAYRSGDPIRRTLVELGGGRTLLAVPLRKDGTFLGDFVIYRQEVQTFSEKQIALLQNFAAQAVIAMENARLIIETREALEQQTATAEVLQVINSSPGDLAPVFDAMLEKAMNLCNAAFGILWMFDESRLIPTATRGVPTGFAKYRSDIPPGPGTAAYRFLSGERSVIQNMDLADEEPYRAGDPVRRSLVDLAGARSALHAPLCKENAVLGIITIYRQEVRPFTDKQMALLQNFAVQAVIAIENARLLDEIRQRQAELRVTFDNMADGVAMFDENLRLAAWNRNFQQIADLPESLLTERPGYVEYLQILTERGELDILTMDAELSHRVEHTEQELRLERTRPDGRVIEVRRNAVPGGGFVLIYSDITERKRSEAEIRAARDVAEATLRDLRAAQANLIQAEKMASLGQLTAGIAHEIKNPLNFVNNFAGLSVELLDELQEIAAPALTALDEDMRAEIDETIGMLTGNLDKIAEHGRRADNIVKSMLEHSRGSSGERRDVDLNGLIEEALNLAYHGGRAQDQSFNVTLERDFAEAIAPIELVPQDITRVCLNLFTNGFYATTKRQREGGDAGFKPTLRVSTRDLGDAVEVSIRDNGIGIPPGIKDKLFQPFFTTKPTGEGTGLGLSISYDIVTQQHGGTIAVDSRVGEFTEFTVRLPRTYRATMAEVAS
jgi:GAF domain-containing protein